MACLRVTSVLVLILGLSFTICKPTEAKNKKQGKRQLPHDNYQHTSSHETKYYEEYAHEDPSVGPPKTYGYRQSYAFDSRYPGYKFEHHIFGLPPHLEASHKSYGASSNGLGSQSSSEGVHGGHSRYSEIDLPMHYSQPAPEKLPVLWPKYYGKNTYGNGQGGWKGYSKVSGYDGNSVPSRYASNAYKDEFEYGEDDGYGYHQPDSSHHHSYLYDHKSYGSHHIPYKHGHDYPYSHSH